MLTESKENVKIAWRRAIKFHARINGYTVLVLQGPARLSRLMRSYKLRKTCKFLSTKKSHSRDSCVLPASQLAAEPNHIIVGVSIRGGQLQRINIARAIALKPKLIVLDEAVSSLDMVTQSHILALLSDLKSTYGLSYLFITHDIKAAYSISDALAVMEKGEVVEFCEDKAQFLQTPHPSVRNLVQSILSEHPRYRSKSWMRFIRKKRSRDPHRASPKLAM